MDQGFCKVGGHYKWDANAIIGQGRISKVYKGMDEYDSQVVVIKKFSSDLLNNKSIYLRDILKQEEKLLRLIKPQNFITIKGLEETQNSIYWITELAKSSLREALILNGKLTREQVVTLCKDLLTGYLFLINLNIFHQDIRPENILIKDQNYYYSDLGNGYLISRFQGEASITPYISPQRLANQPYSGKCDVWSIGVILYESLFGQCIYNTKLVPKITTYSVEVTAEIKTADQLHDFIQRCIKFSEKERMSWNEVFDHPFVKDELKINVDLTVDPGFQQFCSLFNSTMKQIDLYLMFGLNSKDNSMEKLTKQEFCLGTKKAVPNQSTKSISDLFHQIAGYQATHIDIKDIRNWIERDKNRLKGDRGFHRQLLEAELKEMEVQVRGIAPVKWTRKLELNQIKNVSLLSPKVVEVLRNIKSSIQKFNTNLTDLFGKYDPFSIGGITKNYLDKMTGKIYPEGLDDVTSSHVFQFLNQFQDGKISQEEFEFCIFQVDFEALSKQR